MMLKGAQKNISIMTTAEGLIRKAEALKPILEKMKKKGVKIRIAAPITPKNIKVAKELNKVAEIRHIDKVKSRFAVVDGKEVLFMTMDDQEVHPNYDIGVWVNTKFFASTLAHFFDESWKSMKPLRSL